MRRQVIGADYVSHRSSAPIQLCCRVLKSLDRTNEMIKVVGVVVVAVGGRHVDSGLPQTKEESETKGPQPVQTGLVSAQSLLFD